MNRMGFIGGSDTVKIMQGDWLELWQIKTGRAQPADLSDNIAVQLGIHTESFNLDWFEKHKGFVIQDKQKAINAQIGDIPIKATIDGLIDMKDWGLQIVEAKHTNAHNNMDSVLEYYMPQVQTYIRAADAAGAYLSVIFGNNKWEAAYVSRNDEYFSSMWSVVSDFWGYVLRDEEPVDVGASSICIDKILIDDMVRRNANTDNAFIDAAYTYVEHEEQARAFENAKKSLKEMVAANEREVYCNLLTIKRDKRGSLRITRRDK